MRVGRRRPPQRGGSGAAPPRPRRRRRRRDEPGGGDPDVALARRPRGCPATAAIVALPGSAEARDQLAGRVELEHERRGRAADARGRRGQHHSLLVGFERVGAAVHDPDVILRVDGDAGDRAEHPVVGQRLRPERIDRVGRRSAAPLREDRRADGRQRERSGDGERAHGDADNRDTFHTPPPLGDRTGRRGVRSSGHGSL